MNQEKSREFFSAYYEGTLEAGLKHTLEQRLRADAQLMAEYRAFERTMEELDGLKFETIEVPSYLSDRITSRLETVQESKRPAPWLQLWLPRFAVGAVAATAIVGAVLSLSARSGNNAMGSIVSLPGAHKPTSTVPVTFTNQDGVTTVVSGDQPSLVTEQNAGNSLRLMPGKRMELTNANTSSALFTVKPAGEAVTILVAVPGKKVGADLSGSGTLQDFAKAMADHYGVPIVIKNSDLGKHVTWNFDGLTAMTAAQKSGLVAEEQSGNLLSISEH